MPDRSATGACLTFPSPVALVGSVTFAWSNAGNGFLFSIDHSDGPGCSAGSSVASGSGNSGSVSFNYAAGATYVVVASGNSFAVPVTISFSGISVLLVGGIAVAIVGAGLAFVGYIMRDKPRRARAPPPRARSILPPLPRQEGDVPVGLTPAPGPAKTGGPEPSGPVFFKPSGPEELYGAKDAAPEAKAPGDRPYIKCASCGTMNEPWLHNCRWCKRALESTGT